MRDPWIGKWTITSAVDIAPNGAAAIWNPGAANVVNIRRHPKRVICGLPLYEVEPDAGCTQIWNDLRLVRVGSKEITQRKLMSALNGRKDSSRQPYTTPFKPDGGSATAGDTRTITTALRRCIKSDTDCLTGVVLVDTANSASKREWLTLYRVSKAVVVSARNKRDLLVVELRDPGHKGGANQDGSGRGNKN